ncbi:hypothetical protein [Methylobacterium sp. GXF4]|uniref:hypothetical protein n=1 Tax=Methylobacterium sp. GXF4 TaxID=1096546 RepID=UPI000FFF665E|nr:hypothetical protein [Methylobacterium sp. GXF4]
MLIESVADALGVDVATVVTHDRNLLIAGLRTRGGRGRAAARMTPNDAANLIIAVAGADQVQNSVVAVQNFASLRFDPIRSSSREIPGLSAKHTFGEFLAEFIEGFRSGDLAGASNIELEIKLTRPLYEAEIVGVFDGSQWSFKYSRPSPKGCDPPGRELSITATFTHRTPWQVGEALRI